MTVAATTTTTTKQENGATKRTTEKKAELLPVTLLSGFLGAGKTTLLKRILRNNNGMKIALIVNDMGAINFDSEEIKNTKLVQQEGEMVELHNGCICCTLRGDLLKTVKDLSQSQPKFDYLVIESTGISEPLPVAQTFVMDVNDPEAATPDGHKHEKGEGQDANFETLLKYARLDTCVTVVDGFNLLDVLSQVETQASRKQFLGDEEEAGEEEMAKPLSCLMVDQIEFADVIVLNKIDLLKEEDREKQVGEMTQMLKKLNPVAKLVVPQRPKFEDFDTSCLINTKLFDMSKAQTSAGWIQELAKKHVPESEEYGITSFVYRESGRPFHPVRFSKIINGFGKLHKKDVNPARDIFAGVVRSKGMLWLANCDAIPIDVHSAGSMLELSPQVMSPYLVKIPREEWDEDMEKAHESIKSKGLWTEEFGDRYSEFVCIGVHMNKEKIISAFKDALLTDEELAGGLEEWKKLEDPFFGGIAGDDFCEVELLDPEEMEDEADEADEEEGMEDEADEEELLEKMEDDLD